MPHTHHRWSFLDREHRLCGRVDVIRDEPGRDHPARAHIEETTENIERRSKEAMQSPDLTAAARNRLEASIKQWRTSSEISARACVLLFSPNPRLNDREHLNQLQRADRALSDEHRILSDIEGTLNFVTLPGTLRRRVWLWDTMERLQRDMRPLIGRVGTPMERWELTAGDVNHAVRIRMDETETRAGREAILKRIPEAQRLLVQELGMMQMLLDAVQPPQQLEKMERERLETRRQYVEKILAGLPKIQRELMQRNAAEP